jgi:hypothetical protein
VTPRWKREDTQDPGAMTPGHQQLCQQYEPQRQLIIIIIIIIII